MEPNINQNPNMGARKVIRVSKKRIIILIVILVIAYFAYANIFGSRYGTPYPVMNYGTTTGVDMPAIRGGQESFAPNEKTIMPPIYDGGSPSVNDTREFMKTNYSATIKSRSVSDTVRDVKNTVRDVDGRIDSFNSSETYGYVSFVVPKSKFDQFRDEMESLTHKKLYKENVSSQNLLSQKQSIEEQTNSATSLRDKLAQDKIALDAKHSRTITSINTELASVQNELATVRTAIAGTTNASQLVALRNQEATLVARQTSLKQQKDAENKNYTSQSASLNSQIDNAKNALENLGKQDTQFTENIETVSGSVSVDFVNLWEMAQIFSPIHPTIIIIILCILALWLFIKKGPKVEFV